MQNRFPDGCTLLAFVTAAELNRSTLTNFFLGIPAAQDEKSARVEAGFNSSQEEAPN
jgi:hypothetical protein